MDLVGGNDVICKPQLPFRGPTHVMEELSAVISASPSPYPKFGFKDRSGYLDISEISHHPEAAQRRASATADAIAGSLLSAEGPLEATESLRVSGQLRMVWVTLHKDPVPWQLDISRNDLDIILRAFRLVSAFDYIFTAPGGVLVMPRLPSKKDHTVTGCVFILDLFAVCWSHDLRTRQTSGLCWGGKWGLSTMQELLTRQKSLSSHPLFPALLTAIMLGRLLDRDLNRHIQSIAEVEVRTEYHPWGYTQSERAEGSFALLSARMSGCASAFAGLERIARILHVILDTIAGYRTQQQHEPMANDMDVVDTAVGEHVVLLRSRLHVQELQIKFLSRRTEVQLTALFNLIAQKESRISIAVAEDSRTIASASKEDSSAMKTLAAVTVLFLPGTFVASLFAMPLFRWDVDATSSIVSRHFWIYWAVMIPLTVATVLAWILWTRMTGLRHRAQDRMGRESLLNEIDGAEESTKVGSMV